VLLKDKEPDIQDVVITLPCKMRWDEMQGDDKVRFCDQCQLNVHNISSMTTPEARNVLKRRQNERTCVFMYRDANGKIAVDNCPTMLRQMRLRVNICATALLLTLTWSIAVTASGQGMVSAPIDPRFGTCTQVGMMADFGYGQARDVSRLATAIAFLIAFFVPLPEEKKGNLKLVALELIALASVPLLVHLAGTYFINNYGGLGGGF
jgi:hypothetical protein